MALKATVFKVALQVADVDRNHYRDYALTLARHPSETDERMMVRLLAFALHAADADRDSTLEFGRGISSEDEPAVWLRDLTGNIRLWIEVGLPDVRLLRRACGRSAMVQVLAYGGAADLWWKAAAGDLARLRNLGVISLPVESTQALAAMAHRNMRLQCTIQQEHVLIADGTLSVESDIANIKSP